MDRFESGIPGIIWSTLKWAQGGTLGRHRSGAPAKDGNAITSISRDSNTYRYELKVGMELRGDRGALHVEREPSWGKTDDPTAGDH